MRHSGPATRVSATAPRGGAVALARAAVREPFTRRARREAVFCLAGAPLGVAGFAVIAALLGLGVTLSVTVAGTVVGISLLAAAPRAARGLGRLHRSLAARLLGERVPAPPFRPGHSILGRLDAALRDGGGWRAVAYLLVKLPVAVVEYYAVVFWGSGLVDLSYPLWRLFRNHPPGVHLRPLPVFTPVPAPGFHVSTLPGMMIVCVVGAATVLAAPWVTRAATSADRRLIRGLLGPGALAERVRDLEQTRSLAVDSSAALLRRVERDLHDGAQARLATLAMNLGMAKEKLGGEGEPPDAAAARELVNAAHRGAKDALAELRDLARGIHPPVLDNGLADALSTLAAGSAIPVELTVAIPDRPTPAIETIAYFCAAELLANAVKHSMANKVRIDVSSGGVAEGHTGVLVLRVTDDGRGGANPGHGSGLAGLMQRVSTVDGRLHIVSPPGGPTQITVQLPLRA